SIDTGFQIRFELASTKLSGGTGEIACNGLRAPFDLSADGTASAFLTVPDAPCGGLPLRCTARVETEAGEVRSEELALVVDPTPPSVSLLTPSEGLVLPTHTALFELVADCVGEEQHASVAV